MIVLLGGEKGGTGKSTLATNIAAWLAQQHHDVILVDTDLQRTAANWVDRRNRIQPAVPVVHCTERHGNVFHALRDLDSRYEQVIVDAGGRDSEELRAALVATHKIYVPLKASQPDLETSLHMNELIQLARGMNPNLEARVIICMAPTNPAVRETSEAQELLTGLSEFTASLVTIGERKVYRDAMAEGHGVIELNNDKAILEIEGLVREIYREEKGNE